MLDWPLSWQSVGIKASMTIYALCIWVQCRVESQHVVTASNLFKYCEPCHGLVLFKHHDPLAFSQQQLGELLDGSQEWMLRAGAAHPAAHHPFFLWNCLHRAGASQYHGHAQVMLSSVRALNSPSPCHIAPAMLGLASNLRMHSSF